MKNILVIEDEILIQKSLKKLLEKRGANVQVCARGKEAIELILSNHFDKIICDLMLQDITGFDIIEESKRKYQESEIPNKFVIITAYSSDQVLEKANGYGCHVLKKPFKDLRNALDIMMAG